MPRENEILARRWWYGLAITGASLYAIMSHLGIKAV